MCGLIGVASTEKLNNVKARREALADGIFMDTLRGDHSTGMALVEIGKEKDNEPIVWKRAMAGPDFLTLPQTKKYIFDLEKYSVAIAHNRYSTQGAHTNLNAHPFQYNHITLAHNGHVNNAFSLIPHDKKHMADVDSAQVCASMAINGVVDTLERITGAYALVWHDATDGTLNFARNKDRPLKFCYVKGENTMWWMSERKMLTAILDRRGIIVDKDMFNVPEKLWVKFNINNLREYTTVPFAQRLQGTTRSATTTGKGQTHTAGNAGAATTTNTGGTNPKGVFFYGVKVAAAQTKLIENILETECKNVSMEERKKREFELRRNSARPTKPRKVGSASERIRKVGFKYDQPVVVELSKWDRYSNQRNLGHITGKIFNTSVPVHLASMSLAQYDRYRQYSILLCNVINIKPDKDSPSQVLVVEPHPLAPEFNEAWKERYRGTLQRLQSSPPKEVLCLPRARDISRNDDYSSSCVVDSLSFCGPGNRGISSGKFGELTRDGCAICSGDILQTIEESKKLMWMNQSPVCPTCYTDPRNITNYGLPTKSLLN